MKYVYAVPTMFKKTLYVCLHPITMVTAWFEGNVTLKVVPVYSHLLWHRPGDGL